MPTNASNEDESSILRLITEEWIKLSTIWNEYDELFGCGPENPSERGMRNFNLLRGVG